MLQRLSASAPPDVLRAALSSPTDIGGVATLLSDLAPLGVDLSAVDPLAEAMARGTAVKQELLRRAGGGISAAGVAGGLGISRQAVDKRRARGALLAIPSGSGDYLYPACQFDSTGVLPGFGEVMKAFRVENPWTRLALLLEPSPSLRGKSAIAVLRAGGAERAAAVVASFGDQGA